jgi:N-methylhydantoinase A
VGVHTVGAGGGSIAWIDAGGALRVGPRSAGSCPGPACYARGGREATVTDANVVLGRIDPEARLGGTLEIDPDLAHRAVQRIAEGIGSSPIEAALGILAIAEETMAGAVRSVSVARGHDPSGSHLVAFGGAGGLHGAAVARRLGMSGVVVPPAAGVLSAVGLVLSPPRADAVRAVLITDGDLDPARTAADELLDVTRTSIDSSDSDASRTGFQLDVRYLGQAHEIVVPWHPDEEIGAVSGRFAKVHHERYGFDRSGDPIEIVAVRATSVGRAPLDRAPTTTAPAGVVPGRRRVVGRDGIARDTAVVDRSAVTADEALRGPAVIEERDTTIFVDHDEQVSLGVSGCLEVTW